MAPLGSRRTLCINDRVLAQRTAARINDACLDLQHAAGRKRAAGPGAPGGAASTSGGCPFYQRRDVSGLAQARDSVLARPMDVEELVAVGRDAKQCPYYAARAAARHADVVAVPYAAVLSARTREALGVRLAGSVVVFDEAHNVADAVHAAHCAEVTADQCQRASGCLARYLERFGPRLSPGNRLQLSLLVRAADALHAYMAGLTAPRSALSISELLFGAGIDGINFLRLARFVSDSKVLFKVSTYVERQVSRIMVSESAAWGGGGLYWAFAFASSASSSPPSLGMGRAWEAVRRWADPPRGLRTRHWHSLPSRP